MAVSSLSRMSPPINLVGSDQSAPNQGLLMPKLKYRFRVFFENFGVTATTTELTKQVMDFTRPNVTFADIDLPIYNSTIKLAGKYTWDNVTCQVRDDAGGQVSKLVGEQLQKQLDFLEQSSAASGIDYKFLTNFEILDGGNGQNAPTVLETWQLFGCYLQGVNYNNVDYGLSEAVTISMTIRFDNAVQTPVGVGNTGVQLGRTVAGSVTGIGSAQANI
jgi:hypothetical protein